MLKKKEFEFIANFVFHAKALLFLHYPFHCARCDWRCQLQILIKDFSSKFKDFFKQIQRFSQASVFINIQKLRCEKKSSLPDSNKNFKLLIIKKFPIFGTTFTKKFIFILMDKNVAAKLTKKFVDIHCRFDICAQAFPCWIFKLAWISNKFNKLIAFFTSCVHIFDVLVGRTFRSWTFRSHILSKQKVFKVQQFFCVLRIWKFFFFFFWFWNYLWFFLHDLMSFEECQKNCNSWNVLVQKKDEMNCSRCQILVHLLLREMLICSHKLWFM